MDARVLDGDRRVVDPRTGSEYGSNLAPLKNAAEIIAAQAAPEHTLRLTVAKATVLRHLKMRIEQGMTIRRQRIRYAEDLEEVIALLQR